MSFNLFLENLNNFLTTGNLEIPGKECQVADPISRLALACSLFEREKYKHLGEISDGQISRFCTMFITHLFSISDFPSSVLSLDFKSRDLLLRGIEYSSKVFPNLELSDYSRYL